MLRLWVVTGYGLREVYFGVKLGYVAAKKYDLWAWGSEEVIEEGRLRKEAGLLQYVDRVTTTMTARMEQKLDLCSSESSDDNLIKSGYKFASRSQSWALNLRAMRLSRDRDMHWQWYYVPKEGCGPCIFVPVFADSAKEEGCNDSERSSPLSYWHVQVANRNIQVFVKTSTGKKAIGIKISKEICVSRKGFQS